MTLTWPPSSGLVVLSFVHTVTTILLWMCQEPRDLLLRDGHQDPSCFLFSLMTLFPHENCNLVMPCNLKKRLSLASSFRTRAPWTLNTDPLYLQEVPSAVIDLILKGINNAITLVLSHVYPCFTESTEIWKGFSCQKLPCFMKIRIDLTIRDMMITLIHVGDMTKLWKESLLIV